jgi:hypothetical protein
MCRKYRTQFKEWQSSINGLVDVRENAEDILFVTGDLASSDADRVPTRRRTVSDCEGRSASGCRGEDLRAA